MSDLEDLIKASLMANIQNPAACEKINRAGKEFASLLAAKSDAEKVIEPLTNRLVRTTFAKELDTAAAWMKKYGETRKES